MKTWSQLQEWIELHGDEWAMVVANTAPSPASLHRHTQAVLGGQADIEYWYELPDSERNVYVDAVAWKAAELLAREYNELAVGWCESYYLTLRRMYEEES